MKALLTAQSFGYGPVSKLVVIAGLLRKIYGKEIILDFVGGNIAAVYAQQNNDRFDNIFTNSIESIKPEEYDFLISVMEPISIIWAKKHGLKSIYVDSLFWFWHWHLNKFKKLRDSVVRINELEASPSLELAKTIDNHSLQYVAHMLSTVSLVQRFVLPNNETIHVDKMRDHMKYIATDSIIDTSYLEHNQERSNLLISMSGMLSPLNDEAHAQKYIKLIINLFSSVESFIPTSLDIYFTVNPSLINKVQHLNSRIKLVSLNKPEFLKLLNTTRLVFAPPGITTILECMAYGVPIAILPEQHYGHYPNYLRMSFNGEQHVFPNLLFNEVIDRQQNEDPLIETNQLQDYVKSCVDNKSDVSFSKLRDNLIKIIETASNKSLSYSLFVKQHNILKDNKVFEANQLKNIVDKLLKEK